MSPISNASRLANFGSGIGTAGAIIQVDNTNQRVGIGTTNPQQMFQVGTAVSVYGSTGIVSATSFYGDGSNLSNITSTTINNNADNRLISGSGTANTLNGESNLTFDGSTLAVTGAITASGAVNVDATTDSTSATSGALIVDGGLGVAKNVYIGAGLSVAGTLTYEDVTNVDSVGVVTAKSGVNVTGGQLQVGVAYSVGSAGVATAAGFVGPLTGDVTGDLTGAVTGSTGSFSGDLDIAGDMRHVGDVNTKIGFPANDTIHFQTGGTERIRIVGSGVSILANGSDAVRFLRIDGTNGSSETGAFILENDGENAKANVKTSQGNGAPAKRLAITGLGDIEVYGSAAGVSSVTWDASANSLIFKDKSYLKFGDGSDLSIHHDSSGDTYMDNGTGDLYMRNSSGQILIRANTNCFISNYAANEYRAAFNNNGSVDLYYDGSSKFSTTNEGIEVTGFTSTTAGMGVTGGLFEGAWIKAGKLTDNLQIGIATANVFYFTTQETTTGTPNIRWDDSYSLSSKMAVGDVASVTVIATAAAAGYCANWTIDGNAVTEDWVGGTAPSAGGSDGLDIYSFTIIKTGTGTGDSGFKVIANVTNAT